MLPHVFDPNVSSRPGGQGLGLATVEAIVEGHRGAIELHSSSEGTTLSLSLPSP